MSISIQKICLLILVAFLTSFTVTHSVRRSLVYKTIHLANQALNASVTYQPKARHLLRQHIQHLYREKSALDYRTIHQLLNALTHNVTHPDPYWEIILYNAYRNFNQVKGFFNVIYSFLHRINEDKFPDKAWLQHNKGYLYELESALHFHFILNKKIIEFGRSIKYGRCHSQIDLVIEGANKKLEFIECKCITWNKAKPTSSYGKKLIKQFKTQQTIINTFSSAQYYIATHIPPSQEFSVWMQKNNINCCCTQSAVLNFLTKARKCTEEKSKLLYTLCLQHK